MHPRSDVIRSVVPLPVISDGTLIELKMLMFSRPSTMPGKLTPPLYCKACTQPRTRKARLLLSTARA